MRSESCIYIDLDHLEKGLQLTIDAKYPDTLFVAEDFAENMEAEIQLKEGFTYDYEFSYVGGSSAHCFSFESNRTIQPHIRNRCIGIISPNIFVGTLKLKVHKDQKDTGAIVEIEVQSLKTGYRNEYRDMLEFITEQCTELLLRTESPVHQHLETDFLLSNQSLYQKFTFIKSILLTNEFAEAVYRIVTSPVTKWKKEYTTLDVRATRRVTSKHLRSFASTNKRVPLSDNHFLSGFGLFSIPQRISNSKLMDTVDTHENRFIKYVLEAFLVFCNNISNAAEKNDLSQLKNESTLVQNELETWLQHSVFREISRPVMLKLNSPILQRKEGYREVLRVWLMFDLAAKLVWTGGDDVYSAGKKDIAVLYEYWVFFKLMNLFKEVFHIPSKELSDLIVKTNDGLNLSLKQGKHAVLRGTYQSINRNLNICFHYNLPFKGNSSFPESGSWTTTMRPDYTLSIWPDGVGEEEAEEQEVIVHIHFDAKYKISNFKDLLNNGTNLDLEKENNRKGIYKNADLLKMHSYKDAIRRTGGAYVLYPGDIPVTKRGFHEIIPGLGAFPIKPSKENDGIAELKAFVLSVIEHFCNRASQRERIAYRNYEIHNDRNRHILKELTPEPYGVNRNLIPCHTHILVAYYRKDNLNWIQTSGLYNTRTGIDRGSLRLGPGESGAKYVLLHSDNETITSNLMRITETGPRIFSNSQLAAKGYPNPTQLFYLVYKVSNDIESEFQNSYWDVSKLPGYRRGRSSSLPFAVTLTELMKSKVNPL